MTMLLLMVLHIFITGVRAQDECGTPDMVITTQSLQASPPAYVGAGDYYGERDMYIIPLEFVVIAPDDCENDRMTKKLENLIRNREFPMLQRQFGEHRICFVLMLK